MSYHNGSYHRYLTASAGAVLAAACLLAPVGYLRAADSPLGRVQCNEQYDFESLHVTPPSLPVSERENINIGANNTRVNDDRSSVFEGDVLIEQHELRIRSDRARYDSKQNRITLDGNIHIDTPAMGIKAALGRVDLDTKATSLDEILFFIPESRLRGAALSLNAESRQSNTLEEATLTSCPPDDEDWLLSASRINIDLEDEYGTARNVLLRFYKVPILYTPYIEFPVGDKRRSGLLAPEVGTSSSRGFELVVPWYWNIAPNQDAILAPHYMNRRGLQLDTQYRYLTKSTRGQLDLDYLHHDKLAGVERYSTRYEQNTRIDKNIRLMIDYKDVSDTDYLKDFSSSLFGSSTTHLSRNLRLSAGYDNWDMNALLQSWETLDTSIAEANRPYRSVPKLDLNGQETLYDNLEFTLFTEWVNFEHESDSVDTGARFRIRPGLALDIRESGWFFKPAFRFNYTRYNVDDGTGNRLDTADINVPMTSIDSGVFLERTMQNGMLHTLEPRLFYVNIPFRDQGNLPLFDTSEPEFSMIQLFRENRFYGGDRIGDTNQLTAAMRTRIIDPATGTEYLRATIGQIYYFEDRQVTATGVPDTESSSDVVVELGGSLRTWSASTALQWDTRARKAERGNAALQYKQGRKLFNIGYSRRLPSRSNPERLEQTDISFVAPVTHSLTAIGRWNYSLEQERDLETIAGIAYESCCWSIILAAQRNLVDSGTASDDYNNSILFQLVLKGLGSSSRSTVNKLRQSILGFDQDNL